MAGGKIDILVSPDVKDFPTKLEGGLRGSVATAGKIGSAIGAALGGAATIKGIATLGVEFDKQMNTMAAVSQATAPELATVEQHARDLGKSADLTATSASDAAAAMTELVKGGFSVSEAMDAAKGTLQLASAAQIDAAEAATIQSQALQSFGLDADYAATASDVLAGAANASSAKIEGISNGLQQSGAVANQFGLSMEDNATALAMFANAGIQGSDAGTLLKTALLSMTKDSKPAVEAIEALGLSIYDTNGEFVGMESLFGQLETASKSMTPEMYQSATAALFGSDAMRLAGVAAEQGAEGWNTTYDAVTRAGQASEVAAAQAQGIPGVMEAIENQAEDTGIAVYDAFSGLALEGGSALVGMLEEAGPRIESAASNIAGGIEAALPTVERVVDVVGTGVSQIGDGLRVLGGAGVDVLTGIASTLAPAADATLSLTENLGGMTGPLMAAGTALAVGKWQNWGTTVERSGKKFTGFLDDVEGNQDFFRRMGGDVSYLTATWVTLEDRIPVIKRMGDAYHDAAAPMRTFSSRQRDLAASSDEAARATTSFWEYFDNTASRISRNTVARGADWVGSVRGTFAAGVESAKSAGRGIVNALGGWWNLAIAGATMAITGITSAIQRTRDSERLLRELENAASDTGDALYDAFARGGTEGQIEALSDSLDSLLSKQQELAETAPGFWGGVTNTFRAAWAQANIWDDGLVNDDIHAMHDAQKQAAETAKQVSEVLAGIDMDAAAHAISGTRKEYDRFVDSLDLVGEEGEATRAQLDRLRAEFVKMQELVGRLAPGAVEIADAFAVIGDEASTAEEKTDALGSALDTILGIEPTADEAIAGLHEEIDEIADSAQKAAEAGEVMTLAFTAEGGLDLANENSRALREELLGMRDSLETVAATGQDVDVAYAAQGGALEDLATKYGTTTDKVRDLYGEMGGQPDLIETIISVNTNPATEGLGELWAQIEAGQVEAGEPIDIMVQNEDAVDALRGVGAEVEVLNDDFENGNGQLEVTLDSDEAIESVERFVRRVAELDDLEVSPEVLLDDTQLKESAENAQGILDALDIQHPSPEAQLIIDQLLAGVDISQGELDFLAAQSPTPVADLNKWLLEHGVQVSHEMLDAIDGKTVEAIITASESGVYTAVENALTELGKLPPEVAIPITATHQQLTQQIGMPGFNAEGSVRYAANGLLSQQDPQIARGGDWLVWAEDETEGESFIPHAPSKRGRATQILAETAGIFGLGVVDAAGNPIVRDGSNLDQKDSNHFADGATRRAGATSAGDSGVIDAGAVPAGGSDALSLVDTIGGAIDGLPDETVTTVTVEAAGVGEELTAISEQLAPLDEGETITVDAVGEPALQVLQAVGLETERLPDGAVEITASDAAALDSLDHVSGMLVELGDTEVSPVALLDTDELEISADDAQRLVEDLNIQEPTPTAQIIIDDLLAGKGIAQGELDFLHAMSPTPQADLNHSLLDQGVAFSEGELQRVGNSKATSVVDAHNQSALTNIDNVMAALNNMPVERVIKIVAAGSAASALQGRASGGRIPRHASGGRLPTTGPGTDRTDGILGVGSDGVPTSWVDAGEWVVNGARSERFDRTLGAINAGSEEQIIAALRAELPSLQALASGGKVGVVSPDQLLAFADGQNVMDQQAARSLQGALYDWGGVNWGDCSGAMSGLARFATGLAAFGGRFATGNQEQALAAMGFISGLGPSATSFNLGWFNGGPWGGHTAGDIAGTAVEMGGAGGNGKIGGAAAHASHPQFTNHAHIPLGELWAFDYFNPLPRVTASYQPAPGPDYQTEGGQGVGPGGMGVQIAQGMGGGVDYTSTEGVHLKSGAVVPWNTAGLYDTGGLWPSGTIGVNLSGRNERVLTGAQNDIYEGAMDGFPALVSAMEAAAGKLGGAAYELERAAMGLETTGDHLEYFLGRGPASQLMGTVNVSNFGGEWVREAEVVKEAEADLAGVRSTIAGELEDISTAEDDLVAAQTRLAEARASSGEVSVSVSRKIEDAEQDVATARADGDPEKIASAEQKLARAREDAAQDLSEAGEKQAEEIQKALEDVEKAEAGLTEARVVAEDQAQRLEAAERAVIGARFEAVADLANQAGEALSTAFSGVSDLFGVLADQARIMEETEQRLAAERVQRQTAELELQRAALNTIIAEQDIARTRAMGAISVADAEAALEAARGAAALKGQTGIDAMSQALDRARATGEFAVEDIAQSVIDNAAEVRAAQHAVDQARAQAALDELTSVHTHRMAVLDLAQATLTQQQAVALVDISTRQLAAQAAQLGGLTSQGAQRASSGWGGLAQAGGGLGKLVGGLLGGAAGFAVGGIPGALLGGGAGVVSGLFDILSGGRQAWKNREEISDSWQGMDTMDKIITGGGLLLGGGAAIGGAYASNEYGYGPEFAGLAAELGAQIASQSAGYAAGAITSDLDRINSLADEERSLLQLQLLQEQARIDQARMQAEMDYLKQSTVLQSDVEIAELLGRIAQADTTEQADALADAAIVAAERRDQMIDIMSRQVDIAESLKNRPRQSITVQIPADGYVPTSTFESFIDTMARIQDEVEITKDDIRGAEYLAART